MVGPESRRGPGRARSRTPANMPIGDPILSLEALVVAATSSDCGFR